jgi:CBS domain protein
MDIVDVAKKEVGVIGLDFNLTEVLHKLVDDSFLSVVDEEGYFQGIITRKSILKAINSLMHDFSNEYEMIPK